MIIDYITILHERVLVVLLEPHGHRAHLFLQHEPGKWVFQPVFKYPTAGVILQDSLGPHMMRIDCKGLKMLLA